MYIASIDCGTTNTRVYILQEHGHIIGKGFKQVGVRDTTITGSSEVLKQGIQEALLQALETAALTPEAISFAISAGMITSEIGLLEVPHLWAPAGAGALAAGLVRVEPDAGLPFPFPIYFIPGIKNRFSPDTIGIHDINTLDFMRGEETQVMGILQKQAGTEPRTVVVLSSHTKCIAVNDQQEIAGSLTTLSGQLYSAIVHATSIGKSLVEENQPAPEDFFDPAIVASAYTCIRESGLLRALMMGRFMDVLLHSAWYERKLFIEAALACEDMKALEQFETMGFPRDTPITLVGGKDRCKLYTYVLQEQFGWKGRIDSITVTEEIDQLNIQGSLHIARIAGLLA